MKVNEVMEAIVDAYFLPTMGLKLLVICLLALLRQTVEVFDIFSKSGKRVSWNLDGKSVRPVVKSSSSFSNQQGCEFESFFLVDDWDFVEFLDLDSLSFFVVVLYRSEDLVEVELSFFQLGFQCKFLFWGEFDFVLG